MLRDESYETGATWGDDTNAVDWKEVDHNLRKLAARRGALDAEEARWLRQAVRGEIWRRLGKASLLEYLEDRLGYGPRAAQDRVRVAQALEELPEMAELLGAGELPFSAVRELSRVATRATERAWCERARGMNLRRIEELVAGRKRGDLPTDPPDPELRLRTLRFEVRPETFALLRQAQQVLEQESGMRLDDDQLIGALCGAVLAGSEGQEGKPGSERAAHQIMTIVCERCDQGWQEGGGVKVPIDATALERAQCDAERIGSVDGKPARAKQEISPRVRRLVRRRDGGRCCVPGCRSARHLQLHHIVRRADGGSHEPDNVALTCAGHHRALHDGWLTITGKAPELEVTWARTAEAVESRAHVGAKFQAVTHAIDVKKALVRMGFCRTEAGRAVEAAIAHVGEGASLEALMLEALKHCPKPGG